MIPGPARVVVVPADDNAPIRILKVPPTLDGVQPLLDGGWLETLHMGYAGIDARMYFDEEGKLKGLPVNHFANALAPIPGDVLVGPVVYVGPTDNEGYDLEVPESLVEMITYTASIVGRAVVNEDS